jgi:hypothetical protein
MPSLLSKLGRAARARSRPAPARPQLEALEDRLVPTIVFTPAQGALTEVPGSTNSAISSPCVYLLFWGSYWGSSTGAAQENKLISDVQSVLSGPYLEGLIQYGSNGQASYAGAVTDTSNPKSSFDMTDVQGHVQKAIANGAVPGPWALSAPPMYMVVTDPNAVQGGMLTGALGYNMLGGVPDHNNGPNDPIHLGWASNDWGSGNTINRDFFSVVFSHELVEGMTYSVTGAGISVQDQTHHVNQIADFEAEQGYFYRLNGVRVSSYWSVNDNAYIVPDSNMQKFVCTPLWNGSSFTNQFNLTIKGDQLGTNYNDQIDLKTSANTSGVQATMNGATATFDQNAIHQVNVDTGGGSNQVTVESVPTGVAVNIDSSGYQSNDFVMIGSNGSLSGIGGTVNVSNNCGQTTLWIDDHNDTARNITVTDHSIAFAGQTTINYQAGFTWQNGTTHGVTALSILDGQKGGANQVEVDSVPDLTSVALLSMVADNVYGPAANKIFRFA